VHANFCIKCGSPVVQGSRFCRSCGAPVAGAPVPNPAMGPPPPAAAPSLASSRARSWMPYAIGGVVVVGLAGFFLRDRIFGTSEDVTANPPGLMLTAPAGWSSFDAVGGNQMMAPAGVDQFSEVPDGPRIRVRSSDDFENVQFETGFTKSGVGAFTVLDGPTELTVASRPAMSIVVQEGDAAGLVSANGSPLGTVTRHVIVTLGNGRSALILMEVPAAQYEQHRASFDAALASATVVP
jgi:hypothetical protein